MKKLRSKPGPILALLTILLGCTTEYNSITLVNPTSEVLQKSVAISRSALPVNEDGFFLLGKGDENISVQFDDLDDDGTWDEMSFQYTLEAKEKVSLDLKPTKELPDFKQKANAYLGYSAERNDEFTSVTSNERPSDHVAQSTPYLYQYEGPGWENELVAFRSYFDSRNGKDIFGKTKPALKLETIGLEENYHELQDWGLDILKVGNSLGAGALGLLKNDSVYRLGETQSAFFEIISDGPVRAIVRLTYNGWDVAGTSYEVQETITIWASTRYYESEVVLTKNGELISGDTLVTGIVNLKEMERNEVSQDDFRSIYTHGVQSENNDALGMAIIVEDKYLAGLGEAPAEGDGVTNAYLTYLLPDNGAYVFRFLAGWEGENSDFISQASFEGEIIKTIKNINQEVELKIDK